MNAIVRDFNGWVNYVTKNISIETPINPPYTVWGHSITHRCDLTAVSVVGSHWHPLFSGYAVMDRSREVGCPDVPF